MGSTTFILLILFVGMKFYEKKFLVDVEKIGYDLAVKKTNRKIYHYFNSYFY
jgi:hypothetical protein